jgi:chorismate lyase
VNKRPLRDRVWLRRPPYGAGGYRTWLTDTGSLTSRIQARCAAFSVKLVFQGRRRVNRDERFLVNRRRALVREVYLMCRRTPVVFAHSIVEPRELRGAWQHLTRLGTRPLGAALFADPRVERYPLRQRKLNSRHQLYRRACAALKVRPLYLWARRSLFTLRGSPILVTEVFLPGILDL